MKVKSWVGEELESIQLPFFFFMHTQDQSQCRWKQLPQKSQWLWWHPGNAGDQLAQLRALLSRGSAR